MPLARIKKIMKLDDDVRTLMISQEVPILFAKAAEYFISELTMRAWRLTDVGKRRTLQVSSISLFEASISVLLLYLLVVGYFEYYLRVYSIPSNNTKNNQRVNKATKQMEAYILVYFVYPQISIDRNSYQI